MTRVTAETITVGQLIGLYRTSDDAHVVRSAMVVLHGEPLIGSLREPAGFERARALDACVIAWNARHAKESL